MELMLDKMEVNMKYENAFSEVYSIINILDEKLRYRIPNEIYNMIKYKMNENYIFQFDNNKSIDKQNISNEAKSIIALLYKNYMCSDEEKIKWQEYDRFKAKLISKYKNKREG